MSQDRVTNILRIRRFYALPTQFGNVCKIKRQQGYIIVKLGLIGFGMILRKKIVQIFQLQLMTDQNDWICINFHKLKTKFNFRMTN